MVPVLKKNMGLRFVGLLDAAGALAIAGVVLGWLGRFGWLPELFSHFQPQYWLALTPLFIIALLVKRRLFIWLYLIFWFCVTIQIAWLWIPNQKADISQPTQVRLMLMNILCSNGHHAETLRVINEYDPDVLLLEEVTGKWEQKLSVLTNEYPYHISVPRPDSFGISLFSRLPLHNSRILLLGYASIPSIEATVSVGNKAFYFLGTHPPPPWGKSYTHLRNLQYQDIAQHLKNKTGPRIVLGDMNSTPWAFNFKQLLKQSGMKNSMQGFGLQPTWPKLPYPLRIPLDHCLFAGPLNIVNRQIGPGIASDHRPLIVDIEL